MLLYQLLAHGRWFSPGIPASSSTKIGRHMTPWNSWNIAESGVKHQKSINQSTNSFMTINGFGSAKVEVLHFFKWLSCSKSYFHLSMVSRDNINYLYVWRKRLKNYLYVWRKRLNVQLIVLFLFRHKYWKHPKIPVFNNWLIWSQRESSGFYLDFNGNIFCHQYLVISLALSSW